MIEVQGVSRSFGPVPAVRDVTLSVRAGEIFGLIGPNGAGKSTLLRLLLGLMPPDSGDLTIGGVAPGGPGFRELRRHIGYLPENVVFYDNLSGLETLQFFSDLRGTARTACGPLLERLGLATAARRPVRGYSRGMRQRLGFAQALLGEPRLLVLDEPATGLDPAGIRDFYRILAELKAGGTTVVLSSHNLAEIQDRVDRVGLIRDGRIRAVGAVQALREERRLPLAVDFRLRPGARHVVLQALAALADCRAGLGPDRGTVTCDPARRMAVLLALASLGDAVTELRLREPSLEDLFLAYTEP
jgi:Cu-processing system ATP-binding protein